MVNCILIIFNVVIDSVYDIPLLDIGHIFRCRFAKYILYYEEDFYIRKRVVIYPISTVNLKLTVY